MNIKFSTAQHIESTEGEVEIVQKGLSGDRTGEIGIQVLDIIVKLEYICRKNIKIYDTKLI